MDIAAWLKELGLERYQDAFRDNAIDAEILPKLTADDLRDIGVAAVGHRRKLLEAIAALTAADEQAPLGEAVPTAAERRQLTVLFCDLVGSTELSARLDPEDTGAVIRAYHGACTEVVERWGGHVAKYMGDGMLAYFGWPQAHEDEAERAVRAALQLVAAVQALDPATLVGGRAASQPLAARVGIATGLVMVGELVGEGAAKEQTVVGETPNLAARLQALAVPGSIVISQATRRLVGGLFELADLGPQRLKGFAEPLAAFRVEGAGRAEGRFEALHGERLTPLVGREHELGILLERWAWAKDGDGQVVLLSGEPGIGKSRLARALRQELSGEPHIALSHFCSPHHDNSAFHPVIGLLERASRLERSAPPEVQLDGLAGVLSPSRETLDGAMSVLADLLSIPTGERYPKLEASPERRRQRTLEVLIDQLEGLASARPVLAVYEDVHWADPSTRELLGLVIERVRQLKVLALITFRPEFQPPWSGEAHVTRLTLNRLGRRQGEDMVERVTGKALPAEVMDQIVAKAEGVPLFVEELTKTVLESSLLEDVGERYELPHTLPPLAIPATLHDSLMARLDHLAPVKEVVQIGAVIGREFSHKLLAKVAGRPESHLIEALDQLVAAELVYRRGLPPEITYEFKHALVQDVAYESLLRSKRQRLHQTIAHVLESEFPQTVRTRPELMAHHFTEAGLAEPALDYWLHAGRRAVERCAHTEAIGHLSKGLELLGRLPTSRERDALEIAFRITLGVPLASNRGAASQEVARNYERARQLCEEHEETEQLFAALWGLWLGAMMRSELRRTCGLADQLLVLGRRLDSTALQLEAHHAQWTSRMLVGDLPAALEHSEQGMALYRPERHHELAFTYGGHDPGACCRNVGALALWLLGYPERARERGAAGLALSHELQHAATLADTMAMVLLISTMERNPTALDEQAGALLGLAASEKLQDYPSLANAARGWVLCERGEVQAGLALMREWKAPLLAPQWVVWAPPLITLVATAFARHGSSEEGWELVEEVLQRSQRGEVGWWNAELFRVKGELLLASKAHEDGEACLTQALDISINQKAKSLELRAAGSLARLRAEQGRRSEAHDLLALIYGWFTEGFDTADLKGAKALLDEVQ